jgi:hypothetical protein
MKRVYTKDDHQVTIKSRGLGLGRGDRVYVTETATISGQTKSRSSHRDFGSSTEAMRWIDMTGRTLETKFGWTRKLTKTEQRIMDRVERRGRRPKARRVAA